MQELKNARQFIKDNKGKIAQIEIFQKVLPKKLKISFDTAFSRIQIIARQGSLKYSDSQLINELIGLIINVENGSFVAVVPPPTISMHDTSSKLQFIAMLDEEKKNDHLVVYDINDATILTIYYFKGSWHIATAKSLNADDLKWNTNAESYSEIVNQVFLKYDVIYDKLNTSYCYSIAVRHHAIHWYRQGLDVDTYCEAWFIRSINMKTLQFNYSDSIGTIPLQRSSMTIGQFY